jgi:O-antigen/teichoic acid export membrane protein
MSAVKQMPNLASGRLLVRNTVWNLLGQVLPLAAGILVVPLLVRELNVDRFGLLSLVWIVIGYFGLLDLGIGRALTKLVADKLGAEEMEAIPPLVWTSLLLMLLLGVIGSIIALVFSPWLIYHELKVPVSLQDEALTSFLILAASIPVVTVTSGLRGILEAQQRFRALNLIPTCYVLRSRCLRLQPTRSQDFSTICFFMQTFRPTKSWAGSYFSRLPSATWYSWSR